MNNTFSQVVFEVVSEEEYLQVSLAWRLNYFANTYLRTQAEMQVAAGRYTFEIEARTFSMAEYSSFVHNISDEIKVFKEKQALGVVSEDARYVHPVRSWRLKNHVDCYLA